MNDKKVIVSKANDLIAASYSLTFREQRLLLAAISLVYPKEEMPKEIVVSAEYYNSIFQVANPYRDMKEAAERLFERFLIFENNIETGKVHWVSEIAAAKNKGHVRVVFSDAMMPYLSLLSQRFSTYDLRRIAKLSSGHAIRIFEMLNQFKSTGMLVIKIDELRSRLQLPASYDRLSNLKGKVIDVALSEINGSAGFNVVYETVYEGRTATTLIFRFTDTWVAEGVAPGVGHQSEGRVEGRKQTQAPNRAKASTNTPEKTLKRSDPDLPAKSPENTLPVVDKDKGRAYMNDIKRMVGRKYIKPGN